jgi:hypothetical protein
MSNWQRPGIEYEARRQNICFEEMLAKRGSVECLRIFVRRFVRLHRGSEPVAQRRGL